MTRKKKTKGSKSPLIRLVGLEAAAVAAAAGMTGPPAMAAPGDLDPSFGDVGRQSSIEVPSYYLSLWSVDVQGDDSVLFGGGGEYDYYGSYEDYFVGRLLPNGAPDASFAAAALTNTAVYDTTLQSDGKVIGVGTARQPDGRKKLVVFRLRPDGSLDPDFGLGGLVILSDGSTSREAGYSVVIDPDGRVVVAGERAWQTAGREIAGQRHAGCGLRRRRDLPSVRDVSGSNVAHRTCCRGWLSRHWVFPRRRHGLGLQRGRPDRRRCP